MMNEIKQKNLKCLCYEWAVKVPTDASNLISESFKLKDRKCNFELSVGSYNRYHHCYGDSKLYLKSNSELDLAGTITVRVKRFVMKDFSLFHVQVKVIGPTKSENIEIWRKSDEIIGYLFTFEVTIQENFSSDVLVDKSVQISSYKDVCFSMKSLSHDFSKLMDEGLHHDVEFICGNQTVKAHKNILCSRSDAFSAMLQSDMVEGKTGRVTLQDMNATVFRQFLKCLYTGDLPELTTETAIQLYEISDKYCVNSVKKQCSDFLTDNLTFENACDILVLSDQHSDMVFKNDVIEYMIKEKIPHMGQKWTDFCKDYPILAVEVLNLFCKQFKGACSVSLNKC